MSYSLHAVTSILQIPALLGAFADGLGFDTDLSNPDQPIISNPVDPTAAIPFRFRATTVGLVHELVVEAVSTPAVTSEAFTRSPILNGVTQIPTAVAFIGGLSPEPFIATVIFYGDNLVRHLYYGHMERLGGYAGGEVIAGVTGPLGTSPSAQTYRNNRYLFQGRQSAIDANRSGGVHVDHIDNPTAWRVFRATTSTSPLTAFTNAQAIGGFCDDVNDGYLARARSPFAGVNLLTPNNLFAAVPIVGSTSFRPLGCPAGVRLVNMQDLAVGARIEIAGEYWRCYPATRRSTETSMPTGTGNYRASETSFMVGYAYFEG